MVLALRTRPADLPDFERPPVVEVALGVQFATLDRFRTVHAGLLWEHFREDFPKSAEQSPIPPMFETFGIEQQVTQQRVQIEIGGIAVPRYWFLKDDDTELIQFQPDRFLHNWRKLGPAHDYPRYESIVAHFREEITLLESFLQKNDLGRVVPNQCEVTYINQIVLEDASSDPRRSLDRIFTVWKSPEARSSLPDFEGARVMPRYILRGEKGTPYGRLHVDIEPGLLQSPGGEKKGMPAIRFTLTARGIPAGPSIDEAFETLDLGRVAVVKGFAALTTPEMHKLWGRTDAN